MYESVVPWGPLTLFFLCVCGWITDQAGDAPWQLIPEQKWTNGRWTWIDEPNLHLVSGALLYYSFRGIVMESNPAFSPFLLQTVCFQYNKTDLRGSPLNLIRLKLVHIQKGVKFISILFRTVFTQNSYQSWEDDTETKSTDKYLLWLNWKLAKGVINSELGKCSPKVTSTLYDTFVVNGETYSTIDQCV